MTIRKDILDLDSILCELHHVSARKEIHGEELVLAVDLQFVLTPRASEKAYAAFAELALGASNGAEPEPIGAVVLGDNHSSDAAETIGFLASIADGLTFSAKRENMRVSIRQSTRKLAIFGHATIDKVKLGDERAIQFRVRGPMDSASIGRLVGAMREAVSMDITPAQTELDLPDAGSDDDAAE